MSFFTHLNLVGMFFLSGVLTAIYYFTFFDNGENLRNQISGMQSKISQSETTIEKKKKDLQAAVEFDDSVKKLGKEIDIFLSYLPEQLTTIGLFEDISNVSKESRLVIKEMNSSKQQSRNSSLYDAISVRLSLEGEYSQLVLFLSKLTELDKFITVQQVDIRPINKNTKGSVAQTQKVQANMILLGYRYLGSSATQNNTKKI